MHLNITEQRKLWWSISIGLALIGTIAMGISFSRFNSPIALGLDFSGGTRLQLSWTVVLAAIVKPRSNSTKRGQSSPNSTLPPMFR
jgi:preprotein translocase subunit SecF